MPKYIPEIGKVIPVKEPITIYAPLWRTNSTTWVNLFNDTTQEAGRYWISVAVFTESSAAPLYLEILIAGYVKYSLITYSTTPYYALYKTEFLSANTYITVRIRSGSSSVYVNAGSLLISRISE